MQVSVILVLSVSIHVSQISRNLPVVTHLSLQFFFHLVSLCPHNTRAIGSAVALGNIIQLGIQAFGVCRTCKLVFKFPFPASTPVSPDVRE